MGGRAEPQFPERVLRLHPHTWRSFQSFRKPLLWWGRGLPPTLRGCPWLSCHCSVGQFYSAQTGHHVNSAPRFSWWLAQAAVCFSWKACRRSRWRPPSPSCLRWEPRPWSPPSAELLWCRPLSPAAWQCKKRDMTHPRADEGKSKQVFQTLVGLKNI